VWQFWYLYWASSQSYVLTKGWSRFVKDKGHRAGDVVDFYRFQRGERAALPTSPAEAMAGCKRAGSPSGGARK